MFNNKKRILTETQKLEKYKTILEQIELEYTKKEKQLLDIIDLFIKLSNSKKITKEDSNIFKGLTWLDFESENKEMIYIAKEKRNELMDIQIEKTKILTDIKKSEDTIKAYKKVKFVRGRIAVIIIFWNMRAIGILGALAQIFWLPMQIIWIWVVVVLLYALFEWVWTRMDDIESINHKATWYVNDFYHPNIEPYKRIKKLEISKKDIINEILKTKEYIKDPCKTYDRENYIYWNEYRYDDDDY